MKTKQHDERHSLGRGEIGAHGSLDTSSSARRASSLRATLNGLRDYWSIVVGGLMCALGIVAIVATADPVAAEPPGPGEHAEGEHGPPENAEKIRAKVAEARRKMLVDVVGIPADRVGAVDEALEKLFEERHKARRNRREAQRNLARLIESGASESELESAIETLENAELEVDAIQPRYFDQMEEMLSTQERAKLLIALPAFERKVRRKLRRSGKRERGGRKGRRRGDKP